ncbi:restriction endonuclease [Streptosporangium sp. NPDC020145]|uniref:restriction endonuclease n=1 Tax=unclassified Streptosporangium TaxID=2632669 RepID=UPI003413447F
MADRRPAGRRRPSGAGKRGKGGETGLLLWLFGAALVFLLLRAALPFLQRNWPWFVAAAVAALVLATAFAVARARVTAERERRWFRENSELERVDRLTGAEFERLTAELLRRDGFRHVRLLGGAGDRGVDLTAIGPGGRPFAFQCKRYTGSVGAPQVRDFLGALAHAFAGHTGVLVTSGRLTRPALTEANQGGLILVERERLAAWLGGEALLPGRTARGG